MNLTTFSFSAIFEGVTASSSCAMSRSIESLGEDLVYSSRSNNKSEG